MIYNAVYGYTYLMDHLHAMYLYNLSYYATGIYYIYSMPLAIYNLMYDMNIELYNMHVLSFPLHNIYLA